MYYTCMYILYKRQNKNVILLLDCAAVKNVCTSSNCLVVCSCLFIVLQFLFVHLFYLCYPASFFLRFAFFNNLILQDRPKGFRQRIWLLKEILHPINIGEYWKFHRIRIRKLLDIYLHYSPVKRIRHIVLYIKTATRQIAL